MTSVLLKARGELCYASSTIKAVTFLPGIIDYRWGTTPLFIPVLYLVQTLTLVNIERSFLILNLLRTIMPVRQSN